MEKLRTTGDHLIVARDLKLASRLRARLLRAAQRHPFLGPAGIIGDRLVGLVADGSAARPATDRSADAFPTLFSSFVPLSAAVDSLG